MNILPKLMFWLLNISASNNIFNDNFLWNDDVIIWKNLSRKRIQMIITWKREDNVLKLITE